ncbi:MAG: hypothetical protein RL139_1559 [Gemmatimonadota bacterium]|jgi:predicted ArsR family transcriptional regulator
MSAFRARAEDIVRDWHDDPCSGEADLVRRIAALCEIARNEGEMAERERLHGRLRGPARVSVPDTTEIEERADPRRGRP